VIYNPLLSSFFINEFNNERWNKYNTVKYINNNEWGIGSLEDKIEKLQSEMKQLQIDKR